MLFAVAGSFVMMALSGVAAMLASREVAVFGWPWRGWRVLAAAGLVVSVALLVVAVLAGPVGEG